MVIAIDGPAGAGKSTVAKNVAERLGIFYLDTGAMYRAFTFYVLVKVVPLNDLEGLKRLLRRFSLTITAQRVCIGDRDVTAEIRCQDVTANVSYISSLDFVRKKMVELQREMGENRDIIVEGRDIGTAVFPDTPLKFYLDAEVRERARRRLNDERSQHSSVGLEQIKANIVKRDKYDSTRDISPLRKAQDAIYIDSTHMTVAEVCEFIVGRVQEKQTGVQHHGE
jgi:cytidylate kinase